LIELQENLRAQPGVGQTVIFGDGLHVSGTDAAALEQTVRKIAARNSLHAEKIDTSLEDVFIYMMSSSADNFGGKS
jgi:ABC-2 type transport system ATP-binding protein